MKKILFISHDGSPTGAPRLLALLVDWLAAHTDIEAEVLFRCGPKYQGTLDCPWFCLEDIPFTLLQRIYLRLIKTLLPIRFYHRSKQSFQDANLLKKIRRGSYDLIFSNTITNLDLLKVLSGLGIPMITYCHENKKDIEAFGGKRNMESHARLCSRILTVSALAEKDILSYGVCRKDWVVNIGVATEIYPGKNEDIARRIKSQLGFPEDCLVVGGCGSGGATKGVDLFFEMAEKFAARGEVFFLWLGWIEEQMRKEIDQRMLRCGMVGRYHIGLVLPDQVQDYFDVFDVLVCSSRRESFSLVTLEASLKEVPVVCFDGIGAVEHVKRGAGTIVPSFDMDALESAVKLYLDDKDLRDRVGKKGRELVIEHYTVDKWGKRIYREIENVINNKDY